MGTPHMSKSLPPTALLQASTLVKHRCPSCTYSTPVIVTTQVGRLPSSVAPLSVLDNSLPPPAPPPPRPPS